jgi:hypothetical protein
MWKALFLKELRETAGIAVLAALAYFFSVTNCTGLRFYPWSSERYIGYPFLDGNFPGHLFFFAAVFAVALGFRQTLGESVPGTWQFYLHRPVSLWRLVGVKLATGLGLYFLMTAATILIFMSWAATPGTHPNPFFWWMTIPTWNGWQLASLAYLGAFLSGLRPGRWFGTRILPLLAVVPAVLLITLVPWNQWSVLVLWILFAAFFVSMIFHVAQCRDYS